MTKKQFSEWYAEASIRERERNDALRNNPEGGNLYLPHPLQITSGQFWRCAHGTTGFGEGLKWVGCSECRLERPHAAAQFEGS